MLEHELAGSRRTQKTRRRLGRGSGSGRGDYSGRGMKGQKSRSGGGVPPYFEGGQLPLVKRLPHKRGFTNIFKIYYETVNVGTLSELGEDMVDPEILRQHGLVNGKSRLIKVLGTGEITRQLKVKAHRFSHTAREKIESAGGSVETLTEGKG